METVRRGTTMLKMPGMCLDGESQRLHLSDEQTHVACHLKCQECGHQELFRYPTSILG